MSKTTDIVLTVFSRLGGKGISLVVFLILARQLSLVEFGIYGYIFSLALILTATFDMGVRNSLAFFIGKAEADSSQYTRVASLLWFPLSILSILSLFLTTTFSMSEASAMPVFVPAAVYLSASVYVRMIQGAVIGTGEIKAFNISEIIGRAVLAGLTFSALFAGVLDLEVALWSLALSQVGSGLYLARCAGRGSFRVKSFERKIASQLLKRGFIFMLGVMMMHASKRLSFIILSTLGTAEDAGYFFGLLRLSEIITEVGLAISVVALSHSVRAADPTEASRSTAHLMRVSFVLFLILGAILFIFAEFLVPLALGSDFSGDMSVFRIILVGTLIGSIWTVLFPSLAATINPAKILLIFAPGVLLNVTGSWLLFLKFGLHGSALAIVFVNIALSLGFLAAYKYFFGVRMLSFLLIQRDDVREILSGPFGQRLTRLFRRNRK